MSLNYVYFGPLLLLALPAVIAKPVSISVNTSALLSSLVPLNLYFGCDEPNYAYYPDGQALLSKLGKLSSAQTYFRTHNLLTTGNGFPALKWGSTNAYTEDLSGNPIYNWTTVDRIFESYLDRGVKPYVQIGFMPEALSTRPHPYGFNFTPSSPYDVIYTGWSNPPTSYHKWSELVYQWAKHCVEKYGRVEVESWYWQVWNEPNIRYWNGTVDQFYKLHDFALAAVRRALPTAKVGGPDVAGGPAGTYLDKFLEHSLRGKNNATGGIGSPLDFISFHTKGAPKFKNSGTGGYVQMGIAAQLQNVDDAFKVVASFPELRQKPIVIGEFDPDGCAACITPQYAYRNGLLYPSYTAASIVRAMDLSTKHGVNLQGALTWAFEYDDHAYFDGFRVLSTNGIDKPVLNVHRMLGQMTGYRVAASSSAQVALGETVKNGVRNHTDVGVLASRDGNRTSILVWHYHDDDLPKPEAEVRLAIEGFPWNNAVIMKHYRIDNNHSNAYSQWLAMGSPQQLTKEQHGILEDAGQLNMIEPSTSIPVVEGKAVVEFALPIHAVSMIVLEN